MAAVPQRLDPFAHAADRILLRAEEFPEQGSVPALGAALPHGAPFARRAGPGPAAAERVETQLGAVAAHAFVADVFDALRAARNERVAHLAIGSDAERCGVDEEAELAGRVDLELDQLLRAGIDRHYDRFLPRRARTAARGERGGENQPTSQRRSPASAPRCSADSQVDALYCG